MNIVCQHAACLDLALGTWVDRMNTQVPLQNSLFRLAGRVNNELVGSMRNTEHSSQFSQVNSTHKVETQSFLKYLTFCLFPEDVHVASSTTLSAHATACENRRIFRSM